LPQDLPWVNHQPSPSGFSAAGPSLGVVPQQNQSLFLNADSSRVEQRPNELREPPVLGWFPVPSRSVPEAREKQHVANLLFLDREKNGKRKKNKRRLPGDYGPGDYREQYLRCSDASFIRRIQRYREEVKDWPYRPITERPGAPLPSGYVVNDEGYAVLNPPQNAPPAASYS
jgi:hypothetical protein